MGMFGCDNWHTRQVDSAGRIAVYEMSLCWWNNFVKLWKLYSIVSTSNQALQCYIGDGISTSVEPSSLYISVQFGGTLF